MTLAIGRWGEDLAEALLVSLGAEVLERNYYAQYAEVDLIVEHEGDLVGVEVKTRDASDFVAPEETIRSQQLARVHRALATYAQQTDRLEMSWRIDAVLIVIEADGRVQRLDHLKSVYPW